MTDEYKILPFGEQIPLKLRAIYEQYGYRKFRMGKFESYDLYRENKNFLRSEGIITFTNASGKLMALKPDVTISIVKSTKDSLSPQKFYYVENVFRTEAGGTDYREIGQIGLEYIGGDIAYSQAETVVLAVKTLAAIASDYSLNLSHMGFLTGLLDSMGLVGAPREAFFEAVRRKNLGDIAAAAKASGVPKAGTDRLLDIAVMACPLSEAVEKLSATAVNAETAVALEELRSLDEALRAVGLADRVKVDFSVVCDVDYYNGVVFQGYIAEAPRAVISGGRYDNLLRRFGSSQSAVGFAMYLGELDRAFHERADFDTDVLLIYDDGKPSEVAAAVEGLLKTGVSVRAEKEQPEGLRAKRIMRLVDGEVLENA